MTINGIKKIRLQFLRIILPSSLAMRERAAEGHRSPRRWRVF
jgi:hypothetical protein